MLKCNDDTAHWDPNAHMRQFPPAYIKPVNGRSTLRSNRTSGGAVVVAVNNSTMRQRASTGPFRAVMRFYRSFLAAFSLCCTIPGPVSANSILGQASVIDSDTIKIRGIEYVILVSRSVAQTKGLYPLLAKEMVKVGVARTLNLRRPKGRHGFQVQQFTSGRFGPVVKLW